jgi:D-psicose/D-tagatose/L-ribulose 3-epimerase
VTVVGPDANPISPDASVRKAAAERLKWAIDMTATLGGDAMAGPFHSPLAVFSGSGPTMDEKKRAAETLRLAAEHAQARKVVLTIEYLNRFECYFLNTAADARALVESVNHPSFRLMYDTFHAHIEEKNVEPTIQSIAPYLAHVHISENDRGVPGTGQVRWDATFQTLRSVKYDGWLTIEAFGRFLPDLAAATRVWRDLHKRPEDVYERGYQFIRRNWSA